MYLVPLAEFGGKGEPKKIDLNPITEFYSPVIPCLVELQSLLSLCIIKLERNLRRLYQGGETMREKIRLRSPKKKSKPFA